MGPYSWLSFRVHTAYADWGSFCFIVISVYKAHYTIPVYTSVFLKMDPQVQNMYKTSKVKN